MPLKIPPAVKELRIHFGQNSAGSQAVKSYLKKSYPTLKKNNPGTPILIREALGIKPVAYARFAHGEEAKTSLESGDVEAALKSLVKA